MLLTSHFLPDRFSEQSGGPHQQHDNQHRKNNRVTQFRGDIRFPEDLNHTQQHAAQHGARNRTDPAEHRRCKGLDARHGAGGRHQLRIGGAEQQSGDRRQGGTDGKCHRNRLVYVNAHQLRRTAVFRNAAHGLAHLGPADKQRQRNHDDNIGHDGDQRFRLNYQLSVKQPDGIDGNDGQDGDDAYTVILTNEAQTIAGDNTKAIATSFSTGVIGYKGTTQVSTTVGAISGLPTGITKTINNNGTTSTSITFNVANTLTTKNGQITIPVTIDGKTFNKILSYSLALKGSDGIGISGVINYYAVSQSNMTAPTSG